MRGEGKEGEKGKKKKNGGVGVPGDIKGGNPGAGAGPDKPSTLRSHQTRTPCHPQPNRDYPLDPSSRG